MFSACTFPRVTGVLPLPLPLDDTISQLLTVTMNENVSRGTGEGTASEVYVAGGHRKRPLPQIQSGTKGTSGLKSPVSTLASPPLPPAQNTPVAG